MSNNSIDNPTQFTLFPSLPKELRLKIWEQAIVQSPRIVELGQEPYTKPRELAQSDPKKNESSDAQAQNVESQEVKSGKEVSENGDPDDEDDATDEDSSTDQPEEAESEDDEDSDDEEHTKPNPNPFYSKTALPALLHTSQEARSTVLETYVLSVPNDAHPPRIYYNPAIDILYFPAWCFRHSIRTFRLTISPLIKSTIRRIAIDNLVWYRCCINGSINGDIQIDEFKNLEELWLISRKPGHMGCGCCREFHGPDKGLLEFEDQEAGLYHQRALADIEVEFERIRERDENWKAPGVVKFAKHKWDGEWA